MKVVMKVLTVLLAVAIFILALLVFWFVFANFKYRYGFDGTISYMLGTMGSWWRSVAEFFRGLFA